mgnify:FL=1
MTLEYQRALNHAISDYEDFLYDSPIVFMRVNVDNMKRTDVSHNVTMMNAIKYATFLSLTRQGYRVQEDFKEQKVHVYNHKGEKIT